jgi:hypothetical protein
MRRILVQLFGFPWYPIVFSIYPLLNLLSTNVGQVKLEGGIRPILASVLLAGFLYMIFWLFMRQRHRAAFLTILWLILFFTYGHVYNLLVEKYEDIDFTGWMPGGWAVLFALFLWWATRPRLNFISATSSLNVIALGLVVMSLWQISSAVEPRTAYALGAENAPAEKLSLPQNPPDVYYFILDSYTRADLLESYFGYDNSEFLDGLRERGFYVAECSQSNYTRTELSMASSLNMSYLQGLDPQFVPEKTARSHLWDSLQHSAVRYNLEQIGYKTISFANGYPWSELDDADQFLTPPPFSSGMTEFETLFLQTTLARQLQDAGWLDADQIIGQNYRDRHMLVFDSMKDVAKISGPKFVYVHLLLPHPPFVFGPDGSNTNPADFWNAKKHYPADKYRQGYVNQVIFVNGKMLEALDTVLSESVTPPIIIIQGDHGPWLQPKPQHFFILNAYHLPGHNHELYPQISPVNSFRLVFNDYFGAKYDMLEDVTYYSPVPKLYDFSEVPNDCK